MRNDTFVLLSLQPLMLLLNLEIKEIRIHKEGRVNEKRMFNNTMAYKREHKLKVDLENLEE
jgi:hypothetical protein